MTSAQCAGVVVTVVAMFVSACGPKQLDLPAPAAPGRALVVLLPDADGSVGRASVANQSGSVDLDAARESTQATGNRLPSRVSTLSEQDVNRIFGDALSALPPAPKYYVLFFRFESDQLTDESRALVADIRQAVKARSMPEIVVVGHTDTMGTSRANFDLGLKRAASVRSLLTRAGLDGSTIDVRSLGESDPVIKTPNETPEPRNRRVDVTLR